MRKEVLETSVDRTRRDDMRSCTRSAGRTWLVMEFVVRQRMKSFALLAMIVPTLSAVRVYNF